MASRRVFVLCLLNVVLSVVTLAADCPYDWVAYGGSCYLFGAYSRLNFLDAENFCRRHDGGHLVHVNDAAENEFLKHHLQFVKDSSYWMGLNDRNYEGQWEWYDTGSAPSFTDWAPGQPDDGRHGEDCAHFSNHRGFRWNDEECDVKLEPICEIRKPEGGHYVAVTG